MLTTTILLATLAAAAPMPPEVQAAFDALARPETLTARFTQTQHRAVLSLPLASTGTIAFARPDQLRWEVHTPTPAVFVMRGAELSIAYPTLDVRETLSVDGRPELMGLIEGLTVWLRADAAKITATYAVEVLANTPLTVSLTPHDASLSRWISRMELVLDADGTALAEVRIHEPSGDAVVLAFEDVVPGAALPGGAFDRP